MIRNGTISTSDQGSRLREAFCTDVPGGKRSGLLAKQKGKLLAIYQSIWSDSRHLRTR